MDTNKKVKNIMSINFTFLFEKDDLKKLSEKILETPLHYIVVIDEDSNLVGTIDLAGVISFLKNEKNELKEIINKEPPFIQETQTLSDAMEVMKDKKLPYCVVLNNENKVVGTLDLFDIAFETNELKDFVISFIDISKKVKE